MGEPVVLIDFSGIVVVAAGLATIFPFILKVIGEVFAFEYTRILLFIVPTFLVSYLTLIDSD